jgi:molybdopterin-guanine dinucleotide biosynthesis protein A
MSVDREGPRGTLATVAAALLTGGASSRMGRDKARVEFDGEPAATRISRLLADLFEDVLIVGGDPPASARGRRVADSDGPQCALRGVATALAAASSERVLVVGTDLPFVTPDLLLALVARPEADAVVPRTAGGRHPLCALYRRLPVLAAARSRLAAGRLQLQGLLDAVDTAYLEAADLERVDPDGTALTNVNTPDDLARAQSAGATAAPPEIHGR